jgi:hypothetical protein
MPLNGEQHKKTKNKVIIIDQDFSLANKTKAELEENSGEYTSN